MDWVRGRPPDALLFLKAVLKAAPSGLSVTPAAADREQLARMVGAEAIAPKAGGSGSGRAVSRGSTVNFACPAPLEAIGAGAPATARQSSGATAGKMSMPSSSAATDAGGPEGREQGGREKGPRGVTYLPPSTEAVGKVGVPTPRKLAEGALLAPLRDVGTVAGALRRGIGSGLREMAAAR